MLSHNYRLMGFFLLIALVGFNICGAEAIGQKVKVEKAKAELIDYTPPVVNLTADPSVLTSRESGETTIVHLNANTTSSSGNLVRYNWKSDGGRIQGDGSAVTWDLSGVKPGYHKAFVEIDTGSADAECRAFSSTTVLVRALPAFCPSVFVTCPDRVAVNQPLTFSSTVTGGTTGVIPSYNWTVSTGRIIEGQGTSTIKVDTTDLAGQTVRVGLSIEGYNLDCSANCAVQIPLPRVLCRKFDEFPDIARNDEKARLDNFVVELQNDPTATGYVIVYPGRNGKPSDAQQRASRIVDYAVNSRGLDAWRIVTIVGPARNELMVELWTCPQGSGMPTPAP